MRIHIVINRRTLAERLRKIVSRPVLRIAVAVVVLATGGLVFAISQTPANTFTTDQIISSQMVNTNFSDLFTAVSKLRSDLDSGLYRGDKGDPGDKGPQGDQGQKGDKGDPGDQGDPGDEKGDPGVKGDKGTTGKDGNSGLKSLLKTTTLASYCANNGGVKIEVGLDTNRDGILQTAEIDAKLTRTLCNGKNGVDGKAGTNGTQGPTGPNGFMKKRFDTSVGWTSCSTTTSCTMTATLCVLTYVNMTYGGKCELTKNGSTWTLTAGASPWENNSAMTCGMHCYNFECTGNTDCDAGKSCQNGLCK